MAAASARSASAVALASAAEPSSVRGVMTRNHRFDVPLDYNAPEGEKIQVFVREVIASKHADVENPPTLMYMQGGPGFPAGRPSYPLSGWMSKAADEGYRILLLDQRGTGSSTPVTRQSLELRYGVESGQLSKVDARLTAQYLENFRADSIVRDAELVRKEICGPDGKLTLLGQSYGGFCILTYLSLFPESLERCLFTFGLAPVARKVDEVYQATYKRMAERNKRFYSRYPEDVATVRDIVKHLLEMDTKHGGVTLPSGGKLTTRRFLQSGLALGSASGMENLHWLLEEPWAAEGVLSYGFLKGMDDLHSFDTNPIYWLLHESIYMDGPSDQGSRWAAHRIGKGSKRGLALNPRQEASALDPSEALLDESTPVFFNGEMVYPWMSEDYDQLQGLGECAEILAEKNDWGRLYDLDALQDTSVPCAALISYEDIYVEREFSEETARLLGDKCVVWITNEFQHSGLRDCPKKVFETLLAMSKGESGVPS